METFFDLTGKTAVITGGGSGIGLQISELFARQGARVFILDYNDENAQKAVTAITGAGGKAAGLACDVGDHAAVRQTMDQILKSSGRIDILVNNAGIAHVGTLETTEEADFDRVYRVNVKGYYNAMHAVIGAMKKQGSGAILNLASIAATSGIPDRFVYSMTKGAVYSMTLSVARDFVADGIRCNCISPARVHTPFVDGFLKANYPGREPEMFEKLSATQPIGRMGKPVEVATLALYLCSDEASFITGSDYLIDGGFTHLK